MLTYILYTPLAVASSDASLSVSSAGGIVGSVLRTDVLGLSVNPASAATPSAEIKLDLAGLYFKLGHSLVGPEQDILSARYKDELPESWTTIRGDFDKHGFSPLYSMGVTIPLGRIHLGIESFVPYGTGADFEEDVPFRFHGTGGHLLCLEQNLALAMPIELPKSSLSIGVAARGGYVTLGGTSAMDTGMMIYDLTGDDSAILEPLLEGKRSASGTGFGLGYALGMHWVHPKIALHFAYRSPVNVDVEGQMRITPSNSMTVFFEGDFATTIAFPREVHLGLSLPRERLTVELDTGIIGWGSSRYSQGDISNLSIGSEDTALQLLLEAYDLTTNDLLTADQQLQADSGRTDSYFGRVGLEADVHKKWSLFGRVGYSTRTVPTEYLTPKNTDFNTVQNSLAGIWQTTDRLSLIFSGQYLYRPSRSVTESIYSPTSDSHPGFSGQGEYHLHFARVGLTTHFTF